MQLARPAIAAHPFRFGRGRARVGPAAEEGRAWDIGADVRLFATTFVAGFLFVSILIG